jgi:hypothetical protein
MQLAAVAGITLLTLLASEGTPDLRLLAWLFLLAGILAARVGAIRPRATGIRVAADQILPGRGQRLILLLQVRATMIAVALAVLTITPAPAMWNALIAILASPWLGGVLWAGAMSAGLAAFGCIARAAGRERRRL